MAAVVLSCERGIIHSAKESNRVVVYQENVNYTGYMASGKFLKKQF
jgi:hypothetical protein